MRRLLAILLALPLLMAADIRYHHGPDSSSTSYYCGPWSGSNNEPYEDASGVVWYAPSGVWFVTDQEQIGVWGSCTNSATTTTSYACLVSNDNEGITTISPTSDQIFIMSEGGHGICQVDADDIIDPTEDGTAGVQNIATWQFVSDADCGSVSPTANNIEGIAFVPDSSCSDCRWGGYFLIGTQGTDNPGNTYDDFLYKYRVKDSDGAVDCLARYEKSLCGGNREMAALEYDYSNELLYILSDNGGTLCAVDPTALADNYTILQSYPIPGAGAMAEGVAFGPVGTMAWTSDTSDGATSTNGFWVTPDTTRQASVAWPYKYWGWRQRVKLVVDHTKIPDGADLTNFPMRVTGGATFANSIQADGGDLLFTASDGTTKLTHEVASVTSSTGAFEAWVKIPTLADDAATTVYLYFNYPDATNQFDTSGAVWPAEYLGVYHMEGDATTAYVDASGTASTLTATGTPTLDGAGYIGDGIALVRSSSVLTHPIGASWNFDTTDMTICAWFKITDWAGGADEHIFSHGSGGAVLNERFYYREEASGARLAARIGTANPTDTNFTTSADTWYRACLVADAGASDVFYAYQNATVLTNVNGVAYTGFTSHATADWTLGGAVHATDGYGEGMTGMLDEVWITNTAKSAAQITAEYNNQSSPSTFYASTYEVAPRRTTN